MGSVIVVTSGKGGTGKTTLTGGIGAALSRLGKRVLCLDADVGLRNLDIALGMTDAALMDFSDVMAGRCPLSRAAAPHPGLDGQRRQGHLAAELRRLLLPGPRNHTHRHHPQR